MRPFLGQSFQVLLWLLEQRPLQFKSGCDAQIARNLSAVDGNMLLTKCHAAERMTEVSPKLTEDEWSAAFHCLGFVQGVMAADSIWQTALTKA